MKMHNQSILRSSAFAVLVSATMAATASAQPRREGAALAPPGTEEVGSAPGGAYFVNKELTAELAALRSQLSAVREQIEAGAVGSEEALERLRALEAAIAQTREQIEREKVLVQAFNVYTRTVEETFEIGEERLVILNADYATIVGWEGPGIKCVLEKSILAKSEPAAEEFEAIRVAHKLDEAEELVGKTREAFDAQEQEFLASPKGQSLTREQLAGRREIVASIAASFERFQAFQGKRCNVIDVVGLSGQDGNRQVSVDIEVPEGGGTYSSRWKRGGQLTVYVPRAAGVLVRGCLGSLDVRDLEANLMLTTDGSWDRNYEGTFEVRGVRGDVVIDQAPIRRLERVTGRVDFIATDEFVNSGTLHENDTRRSYVFETATTEIRGIGGDLKAHFLRTDLKLAELRGEVDVVNEFGDTRLELDGSFATDRQHRLISESGRIEVRLPHALIPRLAVHAYTQTGSILTNLDREVLDAVSFSTGTPRRGWRGMVRASEERFALDRFERPQSALEGQDRPPGLDVISHAGDIAILAD